MTSSGRFSSQQLADIDSAVRVLETHEGEKRRLEAEQLAALARALQQVFGRVDPKMRAPDRELAYRSLRLEVATALNDSEHNAERLLSTAFLAHEHFAMSLDALRSGEISLGHLRVLTEEGSSLETGNESRDKARRLRYEGEALSFAKEETPNRLRPIARRLAAAHSEDSLEERHEAALQNVRVTNRTSRFLRPQPGPQKLFRDAVISLARRHAFARPLVNTGRMAIANPYTRSSACDQTGGQPVQNVSFGWADGSPGSVNDLLEWAEGRLLLLVFGDTSPQALQRLTAITETMPVRAVQVVGTEDMPMALEHVLDPKGHLQGACHVFGHAWALVRPDSYVAATGESIDATRALELGIVTAVVADSDLDAESVRVASQLAAIPPSAMKLTKLALNRTYERMGLFGAVKENYMISTVLNATTAYREQEQRRQEVPLKAFLRQRDTPDS